MVTKRTSSGKAGAPMIYPWDYWWKQRKPIILERGVDFNSKMTSMNVIIRRMTAQRRPDLSVSINVIDRRRLKVTFRPVE